MRFCCSHWWTRFLMRKWRKKWHAKDPESVQSTDISASIEPLKIPLSHLIILVGWEVSLLWVIIIPSKPGSIIPYSNQLTRVFLMAQLKLSPSLIGFHQKWARSKINQQPPETMKPWSVQGIKNILEEAFKMRFYYFLGIPWIIVDEL